MIYLGLKQDQYLIDRKRTHSEKLESTFKGTNSDWGPNKSNDFEYDIGQFTQKSSSQSQEINSTLLGKITERKKDAF